MGTVYFDNAVIVAGGKGDRLSNIVGLYRKPLAVINGESIILNTVKMLSCISCSLWVVSNPKNNDEIQNKLIESGFNSISLICQNEPLGMAHAVSLGIDKIQSGSVVIVCCDNVFPKQDLINLYNSLISGSQMSWIYHDYNSLKAKRFAVLENLDGKEVLIQKPSFPKSTKCWSGPVAFCDVTELKKQLATINRSDRTQEFEFVDIMNQYITSTKTDAIPGFSYFFDIGTPESYNDAVKYFMERQNEPYN